MTVAELPEAYRVADAQPAFGPPRWAADRPAWEALLARITYRPGWQLRVFEDYSSGAMALHVIAQVEDTYHPGRVGRILHGHLIPAYLRLQDPLDAQLSRPENLEAERIRWIREALGRVELHERDEWLKVDGVRLFDPHANDPRPSDA
jgi:hypothetical protein